MAALPFATVTNESELNQDLAANAGGTGSGSGFTLDTDLLAVNLGEGGPLTLQGAGKTINGADACRGRSAFLSSRAVALTQANPHSGPITVNPGVFLPATLQGNTASLTGNIFDLGLVVFDQAQDGTYSGILSGLGSLKKISSGSLVLAGANTYSGSTTVNGGSLLVGSASSLTGRGGAITLNNGFFGATRLGGSDYTATVSRNVVLGPNSGLYDGSGASLVMTGIVSGGVLKKTGAGDLILSATNTYSGGTVVNNGVLRFTRDDNLGAAGAGITLNGGSLGTTTATKEGASSGRSITLAGPGGGINVALNPFTWSGNITGPGQFIKSGPGELGLTGGNTYTGGTRVNGGTLRIASDSELGAEGTGVILSGGGLHASETFATSRPFSLDGNGSFLVDVGKVLTVSGMVSGGSLTKVGAGALALTDGNNDYSGPNYVNGGVLTGNNATIRGNIIFDSTADNPIARSVDFSQGLDGTFDGTITGVGSLVKTGVGKLTLTGNNTYTNGTTVLVGTLQGTSNSLQGKIQNDAALIFNQNFDGTYAGTLTGPGTLEKNGSGRLSITGNDAAGGGTSIEYGTLALAVPGTLTSDVTVYGNGVLEGAGRVIGNVISKGGKIVVGALGPVPGAMHIEGAYSQIGGTITFDIDPNGDGGFLESALQFAPGDSVSITDTKIVFDFLDGANPLAFSDSGAFNLDTFFTESNGSLFSNDFNLQSLFASDSFTVNVPHYDISGFGANGAVNLVPSPVPEPSSLATLITGLAGLLGFAGWRRARWRRA